MRKRLSPWVAVPALGAGTVGGLLGYLISDVACRPNGCLGWSIAAALFGFLSAAIGMAVVVALIYRSVAEWREHDRT